MRPWFELSKLKLTWSPGSRSNAAKTPSVSSGQRFRISLSINSLNTGGLFPSSTTWITKFCLEPKLPSLKANSTGWDPKSSKLGVPLRTALPFWSLPSTFNQSGSTLPVMLIFNKSPGTGGNKERVEMSYSYACPGRTFTTGTLVNS